MGVKTVNFEDQHSSIGYGDGDDNSDGDSYSNSDGDGGGDGSLNGYGNGHGDGYGNGNGYGYGAGYASDWGGELTELAECDCAVDKKALAEIEERLR